MKNPEKNENHKNSFDSSIKNHVDMPETGGQIIWSDLDPLNPRNHVVAINLVWLQSGLQRDIFLMDIIDFWSETMLFS